MGRIVALLSGGLDSTVALAKVLADAPGCVTAAILFNYGQRAYMKEKDAATQIAAHYRVPLQMVELPFFRAWLPQQLSGDESSHRPWDAKESADTVASVWVPNRNGILLNIAAGFAEAHSADTIIFGANREEAEVGFPDNSVEYRNRLNGALAMSTLNQVRVETPVGDLTKSEIIDLALRLDVPLELIWSCYEGQARQCGQCPSCRLLKNALGENQALARASFLN